MVSETARRIRSALTEERGDVPGWVLICLMTAGLPVIRMSK